MPDAPANEFPDGRAFPAGYFPVEDSPVVEDGLTIYALQPQSAEVEQVCFVKVFDAEGRTLGMAKSVIHHENRFGLDIEDLTRLEAVTEKLVQAIKSGMG